MPWKCQACSTPIRQQLTAAGDDKPPPDVIYHCGVCHLDLVLNPDADQMIIAPLPPEVHRRHGL